MHLLVFSPVHLVPLPVEPVGGGSACPRAAAQLYVGTDALRSLFHMVLWTAVLEVLQRIEGCCDWTEIDSNFAHTLDLWSYATGN